MSPKQLAAAIRKGAAIRPQCRAHMFKDGASCALGAAYEGVTGKTMHFDNYCGLGDAIPMLDVSTTEGAKLVEAIYRKNDSGQTREAIADWLDTLEPETKPDDKQTFESFMKTVMKPVDVNSKVFL